MSYNETATWARDVLRLMSVTFILWLATEFMALRDQQKAFLSNHSSIKYEIDMLRKDIIEIKETQLLLNEIQLEQEASIRTGKYGRRQNR